MLAGDFSTATFLPLVRNLLAHLEELAEPQTVALPGARCFLKNFQHYEGRWCCTRIQGSRPLRFQLLPDLLPLAFLPIRFARNNSKVFLAVVSGVSISVVNFSSITLFDGPFFESLPAVFISSNAIILQPSVFAALSY